MSPTRRDILAALGAAGAGALLPKIALASAPPLPATELRGIGNFFAQPRSTSTANTLAFVFQVDPEDGSTTTTIMCGMTMTSEQFVSESPEVARFIADLTERIEWFAQDWDDLAEEERGAYRRQRRIKDWQGSKAARWTEEVPQ